jgi:hypothetical protein
MAVEISRHAALQGPGMMHFPRAKGSPSGLSGVLLHVWRAADGATPVGHIAEALDCPVDAVWTALDLLDHVGLLATDGAAMLPMDVGAGLVSPSHG